MVDVAEHGDIQPATIEQGANRVAGHEPCPTDVQRERRALDVGDDQVEEKIGG